MAIIIVLYTIIIYMTFIIDYAIIIIRDSITVEGYAMLNFIFGKKETKTNKCEQLNRIYSKLVEKYDIESIPDGRKKELSDLIETNGYLPYPHIKALEELTNAETLFGLQIKWIQNGIFKDGKFVFDTDKTSVLARNNIKNSDWIKREGHNIKLINLAGLGNGNKSKDTGKFFDWLKQLLILPTGNIENNILNTTIYLIPFHPREFGCAYLPKSTEVSENLLDLELKGLTDMDAKQQVQTFITMAQLAGHPVIYDILPQTGRFSKAVLANPHIARWYDINELNIKIDEAIEKTASDLSPEYDSDDTELIKRIYRQAQQGCLGDLSEHYKKLFEMFDEKMAEVKKDLSNKMLELPLQQKLHKRVKEIVSRIEEVNSNKKLEEQDITKHIDIIQELIKTGLWPAPGGAWCSAGVPVYDKMSECGGYPTFKHYDYKGEDVTEFANLDCQTPYYFVNLENGTYNKDVIDFFLNAMKTLQKDYNFDGFRVDHIDHIVDKVSEKDGIPISYRAPRKVLGNLNKMMKENIPYFATLAEYMLWDDFLKEYHEDMNFDLLWGNDIVSQCDKNPENIVADNQHLANYNLTLKNSDYLSILKTYNNQDGEFRCIDQYPGQPGEDGALYKWFKYKLLPGGKYAQRSMLYVDGDESFTKRGIESVIGEEISMPRENNLDFYEKFNAIDKFVKSQPVITDGEAQIICQDDDGFVSWIITKEPLKTAFLITSNYKYPTEKTNVTDEEGNSYKDIVEGKSVYNKTVQIPCDYSVENEYVLINGEYVSQPLKLDGNHVEFGELQPGEFSIIELKR